MFRDYIDRPDDTVNRQLLTSVWSLEYIPV